MGVYWIFSNHSYHNCRNCWLVFGGSTSNLGQKANIETIYSGGSIVTLTVNSEPNYRVLIAKNTLENYEVRMCIIGNLSATVTDIMPD